MIKYNRVCSFASTGSFYAGKWFYNILSWILFGIQSLVTVCYRLGVNFINNCRSVFFKAMGKDQRSYKQSLDGAFNTKFYQATAYLFIKLTPDCDSCFVE